MAGIRDRACPFSAAFRLPRSAFLDLPIREQHSTAWMGLGIALVGHPEVGPADAIAAGHEPAERVVEAGLASHGHPPDAGAGRGGFGRRDRGIEGARVPGRELEHAHFVLRPTLGERRRVPQDQRVQSVVAVDERRVAEAELRGQQDLASEVVARSEGRDEVAPRLERQAARRALALRQQHRALMPARDDVVGQGHREMAGEEAEPRVEPDVLHGPGHGLETQGRHVLLEQDVATLGLETMPRTVENIGFYARLGFFPGHLTVTLTNDIVTRGHQAPALLSQRKSAAGGQALEAARDLVTALAPGYDFTREILLTAELGLGDTSLVDGDDGLDALVLWHTAPLAEGRPKDEVRVLKLAARDARAFDAAIAATEAAAARVGIRRVAVRCQTRFDDAFRRLVARGYRVRWTDLRMTCEGYPEPHPGRGVLFSNWEI